jgi:hypothetical protein
MTEHIRNWHKASFTHHEENACVEVGSAAGMVGIRDTKEAGMPNRTVLTASASTFGEFLASVQHETAA